MTDDQEAASASRMLASAQAAAVTGPPAPARIAPCPEAAGPLVSGIAKALESLEAGLDPSVIHEKGWIRAVRIAGRRIRTLLRPQVTAGDPEKIQPMRRALGAVLDGLSASRDAEVIQNWFSREGVAWHPSERSLSERFLVVPPAEVEQGGGLQARVAADLLAVREQLKGVLRAALPEELRRPTPQEPGHPGPDRLRPWQELRDDCPRPERRRAARAVLAGTVAAVQARQGPLFLDPPEEEALHDLRRTARKLRYLLEGLRIEYPVLSDTRAAVKRFQWLLGQVNDRRLVQAELAMVTPSSSTLPSPSEQVEGLRRLHARLEAEEAALLEEARTLAADGASPDELVRTLNLLVAA